MLRFTPRESASPGDGGFTLIELLIVVVILPLVVGAISVGILSTFSLQTSTSARLVDTANAQVVASRFIADVQSASQVTLESVPLCPDSTSSSTSSETQLLGLQWNFVQASSTHLRTVSYVLLTIGSGSLSTESLVRNQCSDGAFQNSNRLVNNVNSSSSACLVTGLIAFTGTAGSPACTVYAPTGPMPVYTNGSNANVSLVKFVVGENSSNYTYTLEATPRWVNAQLTTKALNAPLTILGSGCNNSLTIDNGGSIKVEVLVNGGSVPGVMVIQSPCANTVLANSSQGASGTDSISAGAVVTTDTLLNSFNPASTGTYNNNPITPTNPQEIYGAPYDSLAGLLGSLTPSKSGTGQSIPPPCNSTITKGKTTWTVGPGNYNADPNTICNIKNGDTVVFSSGKFWFPSLNFGNGVNAVFQGGTVVLNTSSGWALQTAQTSGTTLTAMGTLFYVVSGGVQFGNNSVVSVSWGSPPPPPSPGNFYDVAIWDAGSASVSEGGQISLSNNTGAVYGGVYSPTGTITMGQGASLQANFLTASQVTISQNSIVTLVSP